MTDHTKSRGPGIGAMTTNGGRHRRPIAAPARSTTSGCEVVTLEWDPARMPLVARPVEVEADILDRYRNTPIGELLAAHNLGHALPVTPTADLLLVTCMDHRVTFDIPEFFAYQIRTAGATPMPVLSNVAFAVGVARVSAICVIGHTDCAMCRVGETSDTMVDHLVTGEGWDPADARDQERSLHQVFGIDDPARAAWMHARVLADRFPSCVVAPLLYRVEDGALMQIEVNVAGTADMETRQGVGRKA